MKYYCILVHPEKALDSSLAKEGLRGSNLFIDYGELGFKLLVRIISPYYD